MKRLNTKIKKCLVTGGTGFVGSHICEELVRQKKEVICMDIIDRPENRAGWWNDFSCRLILTDISQLQYHPGFFDDVDLVFHNACSKSLICIKDPKRDLLINAFGSWLVFDEARKVGAKIIHASTGSVMGGHPITFYGVSKLAAEGYLRAFAEYHDLKFTSIRYYHVYGPRQSFDESSGGVIPIFIRNILKGQPIKIEWGHQRRYFTYVKDVVNANLIAADAKWNGHYLDYIGPEGYTIIELVDIIKKMMREENHPVEFLERRKGEIDDFDVKTNIDVPRTSFGKGLGKTLDWYKELY